MKTFSPEWTVDRTIKNRENCYKVTVYLKNKTTVMRLLEMIANLVKTMK